MIELVMSVCMLGDMQKCKDVRLNFEGETVSVQQCQRNSQIEMAKWVCEHPEWWVTRYSCAIAGQTAKL